MKKSILVFLLLMTIGSVSAQNIQLHYDFGHTLYKNEMAGRPKLTATIEQFKTDLWGSTFYFIDLDLARNGMQSAYWEIARELKFWEGPLSAHIEYNGGLNNQISFQNAYLGGATYSYNSKDFTKNVALSVMYKYIQHNEQPHNFQITATWDISFAPNNLLTFSGFADLWKEKTIFGRYIFLAEPQFWVNLNKLKGVNEKFNLSVGSEVEISYNFEGDKIYAIPTLAAKWTF